MTEHTDLIRRLRERDEKAKQEGGDYLYLGPGDQLDREAAATIESLERSLTEADEALLGICEAHGLEFLPGTETRKVVDNARSRERSRHPHDWFVPNGLERLGECCRDCGIVRRADDLNGPCRGKVRVELRAQDAQHD
jgi:hypothetical protein